MIAITRYGIIFVVILLAAGAPNVRSLTGETYGNSENPIVRSPNGQFALTGQMLCTQKDHALVEYALAGMDNHLFVSKYQLELPKREDIQRFLEEKMREGIGYGR